MDLGTTLGDVPTVWRTPVSIAVEMAANEDGTVHCYACTADSDAVDFPVHAVEVGSSRPGSLRLIVACPRCGREGAMVVDHHEDVLARLLGVAHLQIRIAS